MVFQSRYGIGDKVFVVKKAYDYLILSKSVDDYDDAVLVGIVTDIRIIIVEDEYTLRNHASLTILLENGKKFWCREELVCNSMDKALELAESIAAKPISSMSICNVLRLIQYHNLTTNSRIIRASSNVEIGDTVDGGRVTEAIVTLSTGDIRYVIKKNNRKFATGIQQINVFGG